MSDINHKILEFAQIKLGTRVYAALTGAAGECWDLAQAAQVYAGAKTPDDYNHSTYKWSSVTVPLSQAKAGDIIQYKEYKGKVTRTETDGSYQYETFELGGPRHTAIIKKVKSNGQLEVYEQNAGTPLNKKVHTDTYYLKPGTYQDGSTEVKVEKEGGSFTIYRSQKKIELAALIAPSRDVVPVFNELITLSLV